jgi:hypothetical protein
VKKLLPLLVVLGACAPDITQDAQPGDAIIVEFDPAAAVPVVPLPNDLAIDATTGKIVVPPSATDSPAQKEFNEKYLQTLDGFPFESTGTVGLSGDLNPATVNPKTVLAFDVTDPKAPAPVAIAPVFADKKISVPPPAGNWLRGHRYAIALLGGANGLRGAANQDVIGSETWALASSRNTLVNCPATPAGKPDYASPDCLPAVDVIPSHKTDPFEKLLDQTASAIKLEQLRLAYAPILDALAAPPIATDRGNIPIVWTFKIVDAGEMTFDPAKNIIPFPNDLLRTGKDAAGKPLVAMPNPKTGAPLTAADCAAATDTSTLLYCGLNTLDGFSTLAPLISETSEKEGALDQGNIDPKSLSAKTVGLVPLKSDAPLATQTKPQYTPCLNCTSSADAAGKPQTSPQQLQWKLDAPLDEKTTYFGYVTSAVTDDKGKAVIATPTFALIRSSQPLIDAAGKSTVSLITDAQAKQLEPVRLGFAPAFAGLEKAGLPRENLALAFPFTTQSESTVLDQLATLPTVAGAAGLPDAPIQVSELTTAYKTAAAPLTFDAGVRFFGGIMLSPNLLTGTQGTFNPDPSKVKLQNLNFAIAVPDAATVPGGKPAGGWPVTIFGHGLKQSRSDFLRIAGALTAAGQIVIATDVPFHGDRTSCTNTKLLTAASLPAGTPPSDDFACANPLTMKCDGGTLQGLCVLRDGAGVTRDACAPTATDPTGDLGCAQKGEGRCAADGKCQGVSGAATTCNATAVPGTGEITCPAAGKGLCFPLSGCTGDPTVVCPVGAQGDALCAGAGKGTCFAISNCEGSAADFLRPALNATPVVSGANAINLSNFFATRDNFRQQVIDLSQLVRLLKSTTNTPAAHLVALNLQLQGQFASATPMIDATKINYAGQSFGGILGTLFNAVSPDTNNVALNVPGGALTVLFLESPEFKSAKDVLVSTLVAQGVSPGTPTFDQFIGTLQWILDPADPANMGYRLTHGANGAPNANRKTFIQFVEKDQYVVNDSNFALVTAANRSFAPTPPSFGCTPPLFCYEFTEAGDSFDTTSFALPDRHGFLLNFKNPALTGKAQAQVAKFVSTGAFQ